MYVFLDCVHNIIIKFTDIGVLTLKKTVVFVIISLIIFVSLFISAYAPIGTLKYQKNYHGSDRTKLAFIYKHFFSESEYAYNHKLAQKSLEVATASFSSKESMVFWGENANCNREKNLNDELEKIGIDKNEFFNYDVSLNDSSNKVAFSISKADYDNNTVIVPIVIRGGRYGLEWADNFNVGANNIAYHEGFYNLALKVKRESDKFLDNIPVNKSIKLWITGYSRGGAVANILASMYDDGKELRPCQVYAYTFASPKTAVVAKVQGHDTIYRNIFNILSPNDPVYNIPPDKWGFGRFGICVVFPDNNGSDNEKENKTREIVYDDYRNRTGKTPITQSGSVNTLVNLIIKSSESRDFFYNNLMTPISQLIVIKMAKYKTNSGLWENYSTDSAIREFYGEDIIVEKEKIKNSYLFNSLKKIGVKLPEDFYVFISLCRKNGFSGYEKFLFNKLNVDELMGISEIASGDFLYVGHTTPFYMSWILNVPVAELKFIKD